MGPSARAIAEQASFQAFLHGYLQEVDPGDWQTASHCRRWRRRQAQGVGIATSNPDSDNHGSCATEQLRDFFSEEGRKASCANCKAMITS